MAYQKKTSRRLFSYLSAKKKRLRILEVGCGNGWLAHLLAGIPGAEVTGLDINFTELQQAARVFNEDRHLRFIYGDIYSGVLARLKFDIIVFSASIQYFQSFGKIINGCLRNLAPGGEIHIINSPFYPAAELGPAKKRTQEYYHSLGYPEMADYYFHHPIGDLKAFTHTVIYNPSSILNKLIRNPEPFLWVCIKND